MRTAIIFCLLASTCMAQNTRYPVEKVTSTKGSFYVEVSESDWVADGKDTFGDIKEDQMTFGQIKNNRPVGKAVYNFYHFPDADHEVRVLDRLFATIQPGRSSLSRSSKASIDTKRDGEPIKIKGKYATYEGRMTEVFVTTSERGRTSTNHFVLIATKRQGKLLGIRVWNTDPVEKGYKPEEEITIASFVHFNKPK